MGSQAKLPAGTKIFPPGSKITGVEGCPTNPYHTDGMIVAVIDYQGRPTAASVTITEHPATGGNFQRAPYYIDLNSGRTLQYLGPIFGNGTYDGLFSYSYNLGAAKTSSTTLTLDRTCH
jgi:GH24 family phage-related lysozyme (muramidase)